MAAKGADVASHPESVRWIAGALDDDVGSLAHSQCDHIGFVGLDWNKIIRDDSHDVIVDGELLNAFGTAVDESQPVLLSGLEPEFGYSGIGCAMGAVDKRTVVIHLAVDQVVI